MKYIFTILLSCTNLFLFSQQFNVNDYTRNTYQTSFINRTSKEFYIEATPWVVKGGWFQYFLTTHFTSMWSTSKSLATPYNETINVGWGDSYGPNWILSSSHWWGRFYSTSELENPTYVHHYQWRNYHWRRNYNGVFSAHTYFHQPSNQQIMLAFSHGENRNERFEENCWQNSVNPNYLINCNDPNTWSGTTDGINFKDHWGSYSGFLNGNWIPYTSGSDWGNSYLNDLGPIAWPSAGYLKMDNTQASTGLRHPSSIIEGSYVYIYVCDESRDGTGGVKLVRVHVNDALNPNAYQTWSTNGWIPSLPTGFSKDQAANFFKVRGPQNSKIFSEHNTVRFAVAKFKNTNEYIAVEQYNPTETSIRVALRTSTDLIHWSEPVDIYVVNNWGSLIYKYPIFLSKDGTSNTLIDKEEFYIIGSNANNSISKMRFNYYMPPPPPPPPPTDECPPDQPCQIARKGNKGSMEEISVSHTYPNPFTHFTNLVLSVAETGNYRFEVYNATGVLVKEINKQILTKGKHIEQITLNEAPDGIYLVSIKYNGTTLKSIKIIKEGSK